MVAFWIIATLAAFVVGLIFIGFFPVYLVMFILGVVFLCITVLATLICPYDMEFVGGTLLLKRKCGPIVIPTSEVKAFRRFTRADRNSCRKVSAFKGMGGFIGICNSTELGRLTFFASSVKNLMLVEMNGGKHYVLSYDPSDDEFRK